MKCFLSNFVLFGLIVNGRKSRVKRMLGHNCEFIIFEICIFLFVSACGEKETTTRTRYIIKASQCLGECDGNTTEVVNCGLPPCSVSKIQKF